MNDAEWLNCADPQRMLAFLTDRASGRKLRLFGVACCRHIWHLLHDKERANVDLAERHSDGQATDQELGDSHDMDTTYSASMIATMATLIREPLLDAATGASEFAAFAAADPRPTMYYTEYPFMADDAAHPDAFRTERAAQSHLLRDIFGNPFRSLGIDTTWLTSTVTILARSNYEEHAFDRMPELAHALEHAGCTNADILEHLHGPGPHVRGCWVVDLILGKE